MYSIHNEVVATKIFHVKKYKAKKRKKSKHLKTEKKKKVQCFKVLHFSL